MNEANQTSWLFHGPSGTSNREIIGWWEARRLYFNAIVGLTGFVTLWIVMIASNAAVKPGLDFVEPMAVIFGSIFYLVLANVCYTFGWLLDVFTAHDGPRKSLFKAGVIFSIILTTLPGVWAVVAWLITLHTGRKMD